MPLDNVLYLCFVVGAFAVFAAALAYGEWTTRQVTSVVDLKFLRLSWHSRLGTSNPKTTLDSINW